MNSASTTYAMLKKATNAESESSLQKCQEMLEKEVENLNTLITQYEEAKEENNKVYNAQIQEALEELFKEATSEIEQSSEVVERRKERWEAAGMKMQFIRQLKNNVMGFFQKFQM